MAEPLPLQAVIGFGGQVENGLVVAPDGTLIYPLGSTIVLRSKKDAKHQEFLQGHTDKVSCLALSRSGRFLASGQVTFMGFAADIIIWDLETKQMLHRCAVHKVKIQALAFSPNERFLASLGGPDDNNLVLWDVATGAALCGTPAATDFAQTVRFLNNSSDALVTAGNYTLCMWEYDRSNNKLRQQEAQLGNLRRLVRSVTIDASDEYVYCGTTSGDVLQVAVRGMMFKNSGPAKLPIPGGAVASCELPNGELVVGGGDGSISIMPTAFAPTKENPRVAKKLGVTASAKLEGAITSIVHDVYAAPSKPSAPHGRGAAPLSSSGYSFYVGTSSCNIYHVTYEPSKKALSAELLQTAHDGCINDLAFPLDYSEVFATCSLGGIRVWHLLTCRELLRIALPNLECRCVCFTADGRALVSGWSDGKIRAFGPQSGRLLYTIHDAHHKAVTAIAATSDNGRLISGGEEGMVRVWRLGRESQSLEASMKDHKGAINSIKVKADGSECVSASSDGCCIIWDLATFRRRVSLYANTFFKCVAYHPDESQVVTTGTDRKITYWDTYDGQAIRIQDGSDRSEVNALAVDSHGDALVSGGADRLVKLWGYDEGACYYVGLGHSGSVNAVAVTADKSRVVSVGSEGGIFIWDYQLGGGK